jgi:hypothetical protein
VVKRTHIWKCAKAVAVTCHPVDFNYMTVDLAVIVVVGRRRLASSKVSKSQELRHVTLKVTVWENPNSPDLADEWWDTPE